MTSAQTLSNHPSFPNKQKPLILSEQTEHEFTSTKSLEELETLTKMVSQRTLRSSTANKMTLRTRDQPEQGTPKASASQTSNDSRRSDANARTSSENLMHMKGASVFNKGSSKWEKMSEETSTGQLETTHDPQIGRKISEEDGAMNTNKNTTSMGDLIEPEENKTQNGGKKSLGDIITNQQTSGYHLRSAGYKSGNRDANFSEYYEYEYPGRYQSNSDGSGSQSLNPRTRSTRGQASTNGDNMGHHNGEATTQRGGSGQKSGTSRSSRQMNGQNTTGQEEIPNFDIAEEMPAKGRANEKVGKSDHEGAEDSLNCTEELEEMKENLKVKEVSDSIESSTRSPSTARENFNRRKGRKCFNKLCLTDHNNQSLWTKEKVKGCLVCKCCYEALKKEQYCHFCSQIYFEDDTLMANDDKEWIECEQCESWTHIQCEATQGLRNIVNLSKRGESYKYYCPKCRAARNGRKAKQTLILPETSTTPRDLPSPKQATAPKRNPQNGRTTHSKPPLDDWLACEEGLEEPAATKIRISAEVSVSGEDEKIEDEEDIAKRKLDSLFTRTNVRRRIQLKPSTSAIEGFSELDKLMGQYGNKKMQLTEQEIKTDLSRLRELSKAVSSLAINSESSGSEACAIESVGDPADDMSSSDPTPAEKITSRSNNGRSKQIRKPVRGKERNNSQLVQTGIKEDKSGKDKVKGGDTPKGNSTVMVNSVARMQLRVRKVN